MSKKPRDSRPYLPPVRKIELSEGNIRSRWILVAVLLVIAVVSIGYGMSVMMNTQPGWQEVTAISDQPNCSSEFKLMYDFTQYGGNASAVNKQLIDIYSRACEDAFKVFSPDIEADDNLHYLNSQVNQPVKVAPVLYSALERISEYENRCIFLAPVYREYNRMFLCETDGEAAIYDPQTDPETAAYVEELMTYVSDPEHIRLSFREDQQVMLEVSDAYQSFAAEYGIESYLDFSWMKNAFIADYLAEALEQNGFVSGYLSSYDGYTRNLVAEDQAFSIQIFDRQGNTIYAPAEVSYNGRQSIVFLRDFPMDELDRWRYYAYEDGRISSILLNPKTGKPAASVASLTALSKELSCSKLLLEMIPSFLAEVADPFMAEDVATLWCKDGVVYYNNTEAQPKLLDTGISNGYTLQLVN